jgi:hypothetical protein
MTVVNHSILTGKLASGLYCTEVTGRFIERGQVDLMVYLTQGSTQIEMPSLTLQQLSRPFKLKDIFPEIIKDPP